MSVKRHKKLPKARREAFAGRITIKKVDLRGFKDDPLKHYIRLHCWTPRVRKLIRDRRLSDVRYLSLCAAPALDTRLFRKTQLIDFDRNQPTPFVYCEDNEMDYKILQDTFKHNTQGFYGKIEDIATDSNHSDYGGFWGTFPRDVINLDFWGDIHNAQDRVKNIFRTLQVIVFHQSLLRDSYELWVTWRAKPSRVANNIENAYQKLINQNRQNNNEFDRQFQGMLTAKLPVEERVRIGFMKWILWIAKENYSVVDVDNTEVLVYTRKDKDARSYSMYNFLIRIKPYEDVTIPSPACEAAEFCDEKYKDSLKLCFAGPRDIDTEYGALDAKGRDKVNKSLHEVTKEYEDEMADSLR